MKKGNVLDFGCGTGRISRWLALKGWHAVGVDITFGMLTKANELTSPSTIPFLQFDGLNLPFKDGQFDLAVSVTVLQYSILNPELLVSIGKEINRILKYKGKLLCIEITDRQDLSIDKYTQLLTSAGFTMVHHEPIRLRTNLYMRIAQFSFVPMASIPMLGKLGTWECQRRYSQGKISSWWNRLYLLERI